MIKVKNGIVIFIILLIFWVLFNNSIQWQVMLPGLLIAFLIAIFVAPNLNVFSEININPKAIFFTLLYLLVFFKELILSNFDVAFRVVSPKLPINPGIVEAKTKLKSPMGRMILANSITLTPGTFTVEMKDDTLFIHCIDIKSINTQDVTNRVIRKFEKYLEVMYG
jgi:multicomponent Na+:H+ antiporter subunit E